MMEKDGPDKIMSRFSSLPDALIRRKRLIMVVFLLTLIVIFLYLKQGYYLTPENIIFFLNGHKISAPLIFLLLYSLTTISFVVPTVPLNFAAGFLWGGWLGAILTIIGASLGASLAFFISRYFGRSYFKRLFSKGFWEFLAEELVKNDWKIIAFTRINPAFPFGWVSYFFGLTKVPFKKYIILTIIFISPMALLFSFVGSLARGIWKGSGLAVFLQGLMPLLIFATIIVIAFLTLRNYWKFKKINDKI